MLKKSNICYFSIAALLVIFPIVFDYFKSNNWLILTLGFWIGISFLGVLSLIYIHVEFGGIRRKKVPLIKSALTFAVASAAAFLIFALLLTIIEPYGLIKAVPSVFSYEKLLALIIGMALFPIFFVSPLSMLYADTFRHSFFSVWACLLKKVYMLLFLAAVAAGAAGAASVILLGGVWGSVLTFLLSAALLMVS